MKSKMRNHVQSRAGILKRSELARREIQEFLQAVDSYPACAAEDRSLSFQQHLGRIVATPQPGSRERD
jgi:hypothetical protein